MHSLSILESSLIKTFFWSFVALIIVHHVWFQKVWPSSPCLPRHILTLRMQKIPTFTMNLVTLPVSPLPPGGWDTTILMPYTWSHSVDFNSEPATVFLKNAVIKYFMLSQHVAQCTTMIFNKISQNWHIHVCVHVYVHLLWLADFQSLEVSFPLRNCCAFFKVEAVCTVFVILPGGVYSL